MNPRSGYRANLRTVRPWSLQAYMLADTLLFLLPFTPNDVLFMGHHAMTSTYMAAALLLRRGGVSVMVLMAIGESTSIFQNSWMIARNCRHDNKVRLGLYVLMICIVSCTALWLWVLYESAVLFSMR